MSLAETSGYVKLKELKEEYVSWLMSTGQQEKAGHVKQDSGQLLEAIELYLSAGLPATAARFGILLSTICLVYLLLANNLNFYY